ncbi:hypothetical protein Ddye_022155 [Dipteronia dyeriana]|uniref:Reverse transcriptase n=1 Tax=Dipteronia dyeriana TaxID=168575 RepID=A0AAD9U3Z5_9ROSI|nr:hypothetical protein Ddye_022155 [Dipteronia dyeriana]
MNDISGFLVFLGGVRESCSQTLLIKSGTRLRGWGEKLLSFGWKEILIKAIVQVVPSYAMSIFRLPKSLFDEIQRLAARYWWGGNENSRKIHWCKWQQLCKPKSEGGLGFRDLETFNRSLLPSNVGKFLRIPTLS